MLRSAVERQFEIIGEALNQLSKMDAVLAAQVPDLGRSVAFRNVASPGLAERATEAWVEKAPSYDQR